MPKIGDLVRVVPTSPHVLMSPAGAFLPPDGESLPWSPHLESRLASGEIAIVDAPAPESTPAVDAPVATDPVKE